MATRSDAFRAARTRAGLLLRPRAPLGPPTALFAGVVGTLLVSAVLAAALVSVVFAPLFRAAQAGAARAGALVDAGAVLDARTKVFAADGKTLLAILHGEEDREPVSLSAVPLILQQAVVAVEDERFYSHDGVDLAALGRALAVNVGTASIEQGGGTITMQLARNAYLHDRRRTLQRKMEEIAVARQLEERFTKQQILEQYLNTVYFGEGAYGVATASETYFGKRPAQLTLGQASLLAGLIPAPQAFNPRTNAKVALARRGVVLDAMREAGMIDARAADAAVREPLKLVKHRSSNGIRMVTPYGGSFVEHVKQRLLADVRLGKTLPERVKAVFGGGLRVTTTLDPDAQRAAEEAIREVLDERGDPMAAIAVVEPATGAVRAMAGAVDPRGFNLAAQGRRQPGSAFKPFTLVAALENDIPITKRYSGSAPITIDLGDGKTWRVRNYESSPEGTMSIATATRYSVNAVFAQLVMDVGPKNVVDAAHRMGITSRLDAYPSIALGALDVGVSPLEMASAYATLANGGIHAAPYVVARVTDGRGRELYRSVPVLKRALDEDVAAEATGVLRDVVERGTGRRVRALDRPAAGKTGTTDEYRDAWFAGFTPQLSAAVWLGYTPVSKPMYGVHGMRQVFGGSLPAEIWLRTMRSALDGEPVLDLPDVVRGDEATATVSPSPDGEPQLEPPRPICRRKRCR